MPVVSSEVGQLRAIRAATNPLADGRMRA